MQQMLTRLLDELRLQPLTPAGDRAVRQSRRFEALRLRVFAT
jgi:hypothetical protein